MIVLEKSGLWLPDASVNIVLWPFEMSVKTTSVNYAPLWATEISISKL